MSGGHAFLPLPALFVRPVAEEWEWQTQASCRTMDPNIFFHPDNERGPARERREERSKQICRTCPVIAQCADFAVRSREPYGTWGGLSESERQQALGIRDRRRLATISVATVRAARRAATSPALPSTAMDAEAEQRNTVAAEATPPNLTGAVTFGVEAQRVTG